MLKRDPHCGHLFVFRGLSGGLIKVLWHDGQGMCLFAKRLEAAASFGLKLQTQRCDHAGAAEGSDWRHPQRTLRPEVVG